jgi:hypothetical protein
VIGSQYETGMPKPNRRQSVEILYKLKKNIYNHCPKVFSGFKVQGSCNKYNNYSTAAAVAATTVKVKNQSPSSRRKGI